MREITDSDQLFNDREAYETPVMMAESDAKLIAGALAVMNRVAAEEGAKIWENSENSAYLRDAALDKYNKDVEGLSKLHIQLAEIFPVLRQGGPSVA